MERPITRLHSSLCVSVRVRLGPERTGTPFRFFFDNRNAVPVLFHAVDRKIWTIRAQKQNAKMNAPECAFRVPRNEHFLSLSRPITQWGGYTLPHTPPPSLTGLLSVRRCRCLDRRRRLAVPLYGARLCPIKTQILDPPLVATANFITEICTVYSFLHACHADFSNTR